MYLKILFVSCSNRNPRVIKTNRLITHFSKIHKKTISVTYYIIFMCVRVSIFAVGNNKYYINKSKHN